jgi:hypothetical protein
MILQGYITQLDQFVTLNTQTSAANQGIISLGGTMTSNAALVNASNANATLNLNFSGNLILASNFNVSTPSGLAYNLNWKALNATATINLGAGGIKINTGGGALSLVANTMTLAGTGNVISSGTVANPSGYLNIATWNPASNIGVGVTTSTDILLLPQALWFGTNQVIAPGFSLVTVGSSIHSGRVKINSAAADSFTFVSNLALQTSSAGQIDLYGTITDGGATLPATLTANTGTNTGVRKIFAYGGLSITTVGAQRYSDITIANGSTGNVSFVTTGATSDIHLSGVGQNNMASTTSFRAGRNIVVEKGSTLTGTSWAINLTLQGKKLDFSNGFITLDGRGGTITLIGDQIDFTRSTDFISNNNGYLNILPLSNAAPICVATTTCAANGLNLSRSLFDYGLANNFYGIAIGGYASGGGGTVSSNATGGIKVNTNISDVLNSANPLYFLQSNGVASQTGGVVTVVGTVNMNADSANWAANASAPPAFVGMRVYGSGYLQLNGVMAVNGPSGSSSGLIINSPMNLLGAAGSLISTGGTNADVYLSNITSTSNAGGTLNVTAGGNIVFYAASQVNSNSGPLNLNLITTGGITKGIDLSQGNISLNANGGNIVFSTDKIALAGTNNSIASLGGTFTLNSYLRSSSICLGNNANCQMNLPSSMFAGASALFQPNF